MSLHYNSHFTMVASKFMTTDQVSARAAARLRNIGPYHVVIEGDRVVGHWQSQTQQEEQKEARRKHNKGIAP